MTAALAVGYDWLYDFVSPADRAMIRAAIVRNGLQPGLAGLRPKGHLTTLHNNWVQVCHGGLTLGALALADEEPAVARAVVEKSRPAMARIMRLFAPDGGFEEGPIYWDFATSYNVFYLAALDTALGTDFGLAQTKGFADTGRYRIQTIGPLWKLANFGDCGEWAPASPQMFWLAQKFHRPEYALHEREFVAAKGSSGRFAILDLLWLKAASDLPAAIEPPRGVKFDRINAAFFRTSWNDPQAIYVAFKGGDNHASHTHLDLGQFILDAFGQRWAIDMGPDNYGLPGYFGKQRWSYYRIGSAGHNTLTINDQNQALDAAAPLVAFESSPGRSFAIADLSAAYREQLHSWQRGIALLDGRRVLLQDEIAPAKGVPIVWHLHTRATTAIGTGGARAVLSQGGESLTARILSPPGGTFSTMKPNPAAAPDTEPRRRRSDDPSPLGVGPHDDHGPICFRQQSGHANIEAAETVAGRTRSSISEVDDVAEFVKTPLPHCDAARQDLCRITAAFFCWEWAAAVQLCLNWERLRP